MEKEFFDLFELQSMLKEGIECLFPDKVWIRAEVSAVKARNGGHCYMELSQTEDGRLVAKAGAIMWSSKYRFIAPYFQSVTGSPLSEGMVILAQVQVTYSELYGLSFIINDIDAEFTLGAKEMERQQTIARLVEEGLMGLQQELQMPALPYALAVISAEDAAGYRDFMRHLHENQYGFSFRTDLYPALMQGAGSPASIVEAMDAVMESGMDYDAVLILRGGGSKLDLACFDDYGLASVIAQYPIPVLTAIGHDQDHHVADMVAHAYVKTPTALADYFLEIYEDEDARLESCMTRLRLAFSSRISVAEAALSALESRVWGGLKLKMSAMESALNVLETRIMSADPRRILERGYVLAVDGRGIVVKGAEGVKAGDRMTLMFPDGALECIVDSVRHSEKGQSPDVRI